MSKAKQILNTMLEAEPEDWERRANGQKPEPAYEIFADGSWKNVRRPE